jgi:hypothetical protein
MRTIPALVALLLCAAPAFWTTGVACGDKFLLVGRSARFNQAYAAIYPATVLIYARPGRTASTAILDPKFQASLTRAGHRVEVVKDEEQVAALLQAGRFDLVLTDVADAEMTKAKADLAPTKPTVMPVLTNPTKADVQTIRAKYQCEVNPSDRPARYLSSIDEEMQTRIKQRATHNLRNP